MNFPSAHEQSLQRELASSPSLSQDDHGCFEVGPLGLPVLKKHGVNLTMDDFKRMVEEAEEEEFQHAMWMRDSERH